MGSGRVASVLNEMNNEPRMGRQHTDKDTAMHIFQVYGNTWCIRDYQLIPFYKLDEHRIILLDTGELSQRQAIENLLEKEDLIPAGIICSHVHMDHAGNNSYFQEKFQIPVAMTLAEAGICSNITGIKSTHDYSPGFIEKTPFFRSMLCRPERIILPEEKTISFCGAEFGIIPTPGHTPGHICIMTPDRVLYLADAVLYGSQLTSSRLPYHFVIGEALASVKRLRNVSCDFCIAAHKGVSNDLTTTVNSYLLYMDRLIRRLLSLLPDDQAITRDEMIYLVQKELRLISSHAPKSALFHHMVSVYIDYLIDEGALEISVMQGATYYRRIKDNLPGR